MINSQASSSRSTCKDPPLVFVSTTTAVFSEASRTAARSHAAAWSRRRLKEARAKPTTSQIHDSATDHGRLSDDLEPTLPVDKVQDQTGRYAVDKTKEATCRSNRRPTGEHRNLSVRSSGSHAKPRNLSYGNTLIKRGHRSGLSLAACGKKGFLDPFDSLAVKVDSIAYDLLQFYKSLPPMAWDSQPYVLNGDDLNADNGSIVQSCMSSKLNFYTFLALSAALMETFGIAQVTLARSTRYSQCALEEIQTQLRNETVNDVELLQGVSTLFMAAAIQGDVAAARVHLRATKYLIDRAGGFEWLRPLVAQCIRYGDFHLAIETLSPPVFSLDFEPDGFPDQQYKPDPLLEQMRTNAVQIFATHLPSCLIENLHRLLQCAEVLDGIWAQTNAPSMGMLNGLLQRLEPP